jgi:hypothetical protein
VHVTKQSNLTNSDQKDEGAFELLRVWSFFLASICTHLPNRLQVRNRFASSNVVGGYRDINFKIRVGFKCDIKTGQPLFCSVSVAPRWNSSATTSHIIVQKPLAWVRC